MVHTQKMHKKYVPGIAGTDNHPVYDNSHYITDNNNGNTNCN